MHAYKDIESRDILKMIPIEDVVEYFGMNKLISEFGIEETLDCIDEEEIARYAKGLGLLDEDESN